MYFFLLQAHAECVAEAKRLLRMPPILPERPPRGALIEVDDKLACAVKHRVIFTDTTQHKEDEVTPLTGLAWHVFMLHLSGSQDCCPRSWWYFERSELGRERSNVSVILSQTRSQNVAAKDASHTPATWSAQFRSPPQCPGCCLCSMCTWLERVYQSKRNYFMDHPC